MKSPTPIASNKHDIGDSRHHGLDDEDATDHLEPNLTLCDYSGMSKFQEQESIDDDDYEKLNLLERIGEHELYGQHAPTFSPCLPLNSPPVTILHPPNLESAQARSSKHI